MRQYCNPSYSGGRDQEGGDSKPLRANNFRDTIVKKKAVIKRLVEWLKV
jgi:hypothetical protein